MSVVARGRLAGIVATTVAWTAAVVLVSGQSPPAPTPGRGAALPAAPGAASLAAQSAVMAEQVFKNVQVLKGLSVNDFMGTMGVFSAALGMSCEDCHASGGANWEAYAKDNPRKQMTRVMVTMMATINKTHFRGRQMVTCYSCHRGSDRPKVTASLEQLYGFPPPEEPPDVIAAAPGAPPAEQILDKYIQAVGGAQRLAALTSFVGRGTSVGYGPESETRPVEVYAKAPSQRSVVIQTTAGNDTATFDGRAAWLAAPFRPVPVLALTGQDLAGAKIEAALGFPGNIKTSLTEWRVGRPTTIEDREVQVVQGTGDANALVTLLFDAESGLLVRSVRYADSPVGRLPSQVDYSDYRDVAGVKMPFKFTSTWLGGRNSFELSEIRPNVTIEASRFARPAPPVPPAARR
jgi:photosynthetic reaction center cytochrome c subunit